MTNLHNQLNKSTEKIYFYFQCKNHFKMKILSKTFNLIFEQEIKTHYLQCTVCIIKHEF